MAWEFFKGSLIGGFIPEQQDFGTTIFESGQFEGRPVDKQIGASASTTSNRPFISDNNNNYITMGTAIMRNYYSGSSVGVDIRVNGVIASSDNVTNGNLVSVGFTINHEKQLATAYRLTRRNDGIWFITGLGGTKNPSLLYQWLVLNIEPPYNLRSIDKVVGVEATLWLSSIKDEFLNGGDPVLDVPIDYMRSRDPRSLIYDLSIGTSPKLLCTTNDTENEKTELLLSWSGDDYTLIGKPQTKLADKPQHKLVYHLALLAQMIIWEF